MEPILVTGAGGGAQGATGRAVAEALLRADRPVRAFVHSDDARAASLRELGAEVMAGDLREIAAVLPAVKGVRRAYFTYPVTAGLLEAAAALAAAGRVEGLERVVAVSQLGSDPQAGTPHMRRHWVAEQVLDRADIGATHLRAAVFYENLRFAIGDSGEMALPLGSPDTVLPLVAARDVARVGAALLLEPGPVDPVHWLVGDVMTAGDAATALGVPYVDVDPDEWSRRARAKHGDEVAVEHLSHLWKLFKDIGSGHQLYQVTDVIERFGGEPPLTLREYASRD